MSTNSNNHKCTRILIEILNNRKHPQAIKHLHYKKNGYKLGKKKKVLKIPPFWHTFWQPLVMTILILNCLHHTHVRVTLRFLDSL